MAAGYASPRTDGLAIGSLIVGILSLDDLAVRTGDEVVSGNTLEGVAWPAVP